MSKLKKVTFDCEVITPMFLAGAEQDKPEIRAASIRGIIRFWWRAMQTGIPSYEEMQKKEAEIFGGTNEQQGQGAVFTIIKNVIGEIGTDLWSDSKLKRPGFNQNDKRMTGDNSGIGFLYYSKLPNRKNPEIPFYKPGTVFKLDLKSKNEESLTEVVYSFYLASVFGGLGSRSRRTAGSFRITSYNSNFQNISNEKVDFTKIDFSSIKNHLKGKNHLELHSSLVGSSFYQSKESFKNWDNTVNDIGKQYEIFRFKNRKKLYETPALGAPVMHNRKTPYGASYKNNKGKYEKVDRRSSPIYMSIFKEKDTYRWLITYLAGKIFPDHYTIANLKFVNQNGNDKNAKPVSTALFNPSSPFTNNHIKV